MALSMTYGWKYNKEPINIKEFTDNVVTHEEVTNTASNLFTVTGDGLFDIMMMTATQHLAAQFDSGRIRGEDYSAAYVQIYQATLQAAMQSWIQKPLAELQLESEEAKKELYYRQIEGFDEDYKQKILKICMDSWAVGFSVARDSFQASGIPGPMQKGTIDDLYNNFIQPELDMYTYKRHPDTLNRDQLPTTRESSEPKEWFYLEDDGRKGPKREIELQEMLLEGTIGYDAFVWKEGMSQWEKLIDVPELKTFIDDKLPPAIPGP